MILKSLFKKFIQYQEQKNDTTPTKTFDAKKSDDTDDLLEGLKENINTIKELLGASQDVKYHNIKLKGINAPKAVLIFIDGLVNEKIITDGILAPLLDVEFNIAEGAKVEKLAQKIDTQILHMADVEVSTKISELISSLLSGSSALVIDGIKECLLISTKGFPTRSISEPQTEMVVRGPREGFTENLRTNTAMIRRRIKSPKLRMEHLTIGKKTDTVVCLTYIKDVARTEIVDKLKERLKKIDTDAINDTGYIEEFIEGSPFSLFETVGYTEKPDVAAAKMLEGRIAILVDGSPFAITVPRLFVENFQTAEDYYTRYVYASVTRLMRFVAYFLSIFTVPVYIALTTFHQELIPETLLVTIANAREGTPFPVFFEALIMVISFEVLKEAGLRLPRPVGQAISIVGALVMGDAAISAGLVGAPVVIAVAFTAVAGFIVPAQTESASILRIIMMVISAILGGYGLALGVLGMLIHLASLKSFGIDYLTTVVPSTDIKDSFFRTPLWTMVSRPVSIVGKDKTRMVPAMQVDNDKEG
jgi:spore germination protein KA